MSDILSPQMLADEAQQAYQRADYVAAAKGYLAAAQSFDALEDLPAAAEMRNNASVAWLKANNAQAAYQSAKDTPAIFAQCNDLCREGMAWGNLAAALEALARIPEAIQSYETALERFDACGERQHRAYVFKELATLKLRTGKQLESLALMEAGLTDIPKLSGSQRLLRKLLKLWRRVSPL